MLFNLLTPLADSFLPFNLFRYITFRTGGAIMTALFISFLMGPKVIDWLRSTQNGASNIREDVPEGHLAKAGTPTMGGFLILLAIVFSTLLWGGYPQRLRLDRGARYHGIRRRRFRR